MRTDTGTLATELTAAVADAEAAVARASALVAAGGLAV